MVGTSTRRASLVFALSLFKLQPCLADEGAQATMGPLVALDVEPELLKDSRDALLSSCASVLGPAEERSCVLGKSASSDTLEATIRWKTNDSGLQVTIELLEAPNNQRVIRVLSFHETSTESERWQAIGLVVAALAVARVPEEAQEPGKTLEQPEPVTAVASTPTPATQAKKSWGLEIGGLARQELNGDFLTGGGEIRGFLDLGSFVEANLALGFLAGSSPVNQISIRPSAGFGMKLVEAPVTLLLRLQGFVLATRWSESDPLGSDSEWHPRWGASLGPLLRVPFTPALGMFVGVAGSVNFPPIEVQVRGEPYGETSIFAAEASLGVLAQF